LSGGCCGTFIVAESMHAGEVGGVSGCCGWLEILQWCDHIMPGIDVAYAWRIEWRMGMV
jgi:hypothetical protein